MLELAFKYKKEVNKKLLETAFDERYIYYHISYINYEIEIKNSSWNKLQFVSINKDNDIVGYFSASVDRTSNKISSLAIMNFHNDDSITFAIDFKRLIINFFEVYNFNKIEFSVVTENPAMKIYDRFIEKYNGSVVGVFHDTTHLWDGKLYDMKYYEIMRDKYLEAKPLPKKMFEGYYKF